MKAIFVLAIILLFSTNLVSQIDSVQLTADEIQSQVDKLGVKLLLNDKQKNDLSNILSGYSAALNSLLSKGNVSTEQREKLIADTDEKIKLLFDEKQKMKYDILKKEWWETLKSKESN